MEAIINAIACGTIVYFVSVFLKGILSKDDPNGIFAENHEESVESEF